jgi:hypothetical protein
MQYIWPCHFKGFLAEINLFFKAFVGCIVEFEFDGGTGDGEDEAEGGGHDFQPRSGFDKPFSGDVDLVYALFGMIGIKQGQGHAGMFTPEGDLEFGAEPFGFVEEFGVEGFGAETPRKPMGGVTIVIINPPKNYVMFMGKGERQQFHIQQFCTN